MEYGFHRTFVPGEGLLGSNFLSFYTEQIIKYTSCYSKLVRFLLSCTDHKNYVTDSSLI